MGREQQNEPGSKPSKGAASRQTRLEQELRANLLKRKEQARTRQGSTIPRKEGDRAKPKE